MKLFLKDKVPSNYNRATWVDIVSQVERQVNDLSEGRVSAYHGKVSAAPTSGSWVRGDWVKNSLPSNSGWFGWICTESGTPGTWEGFALIAAGGGGGGISLPIGAHNVTFTQSGSGVVSETVSTALQRLVFPEQYGAVGDGVANDYAALAAWLASGHKHLLAMANKTYLIGTDTALTVPTGVTVEAGGPTTIFKKSSGTADIFTTTGNNVTFRNFRMEGPNNTACDGISTDGGSDILIENIEGHQLASTVTIGLTSATARPTVNNVYSESNVQQGVHINLAASPRFHNIRSKNIGTTSLHHGLYVGNCTDVIGSQVEGEGCAGFGLHVFVQNSFNGDRVVIDGVNCHGNGTAASGTRGGVAVGVSASTSNLDSVILTGVQAYNNSEYNIYCGGVTDLQIGAVHADGNNETTTQGIFIENQFATTCAARISGGISRAHDSNVRLVAGATATLNVSLQDLLMADADSGGNAGIFANGAGTINLDIGTGCRFSNNASNVAFSPSAGSVNYASSVIPPGSFTGTLTGVSGSVTGTIEYSVNGDVVTLEIPSISGTSNTTACTITGIPTVIRPTAGAGQNCVGITVDNTSTRTVSRVHVGNDGVLTLHVGTSATFTGSGTKGIEPCSFSYRLT